MYAGRRAEARSRHHSDPDGDAHADSRWFVWNPARQPHARIGS